MQEVLVVCVGNICRSPVGERLLAASLSDKMRVSSAGIGALVGHAADADMTSVADEAGLSLAGHSARQFTKEIGTSADLILVMEAGHKQAITQDHPEFSGKIFLFDRWVGAEGIEDPYRQPRALHAKVFEQIKVAAEAWCAKL